MAVRIDECPNCGVELNPRSDPQNRELHRLITAISKQKQWAGKWLDKEKWKRLLTAAFSRANKQSAEIYPALDGQGFDVIYKRSSRMSKAEMSAFIDYLGSYCAENEIDID